MTDLSQLQKTVMATSNASSPNMTLEQVCLNLHFDANKLWLAARGENADTAEVRKRLANVLVGGLVAAGVLHVGDVEDLLTHRVAELEKQGV